MEEGKESLDRVAKLVVSFWKGKESTLVWIYIPRGVQAAKRKKIGKEGLGVGT
jgi:hypothetical protein